MTVFTEIIKNIFSIKAIMPIFCLGVLPMFKVIIFFLAGISGINTPTGVASTPVVQEQLWAGAALVDFDEENPKVSILANFSPTGNYAQWKEIRLKEFHCIGSVHFFRMPKSIGKSFEIITVDTARKTLMGNAVMNDKSGSPICDVMIVAVNRRGPVERFSTPTITGRIYWFDVDNVVIRYGPWKTCGEHFAYPSPLRNRGSPH